MYQPPELKEKYQNDRSSRVATLPEMTALQRAVCNAEGVYDHADADLEEARWMACEGVPAEGGWVPPVGRAKKARAEARAARKAARKALALEYAERDKHNKSDDDCPVIGCPADGPCPKHYEITAA